MKSRHHAREVALQILYRYDIAKTPGKNPVVTPLGGLSRQPELPALGAAAFAQELGEHFDHFQVPAELREFAAELVAGTLRELPELDSVLETHAANWKIARMDSVDRSLLRMAVYELKHFPETDAAVVINEAIELGKQFGAAETPAFINGILDSFKESFKESGRQSSKNAKNAAKN